MSGAGKPKRHAKDLRNDVRMDGVGFFRTSVDVPFRASLDPGNYSYCVMVSEGTLALEIDFPTAAVIRLARGDVVAVSGLAPHSFFSPDLPQTQPSRFERFSLGRPGPKRDIALIIGMAPSESLALGSLMLGPIVIRPTLHPELARSVWRAAEMLEDEYADPGAIDRDLVVRRLAEIMLIDMTRRLIADRRDTPRATENHKIKLAIDAFFAMPDRRWNLSELARAAGMSRTRFAEEFKLVTGQTPVRVMSRMRLTAVARRLASSSLSVEDAAGEAGYSSAAAFVRAFEREFGETPARWRKRQSARVAQGAFRETGGRPNADIRVEEFQ